MAESMNVLSIEQMKELQALGCNVRKASRAYIVSDINNVIDEKTHSAWEEFAYDDETAPVEKLSTGYLATRFGKMAVYTFTATDIVDLFKALTTKSFVLNGRHYYTADDSANHHAQSNVSLLDALFKLLKTALEDKHNKTLIEEAYG